MRDGQMNGMLPSLLWDRMDALHPLALVVLLSLVLGGLTYCRERLGTRRTLGLGLDEAERSVRRENPLVR